VNEVIPEPSLTLVLKKYHQAIKEKKTIRWEETTDYPAGRLTAEVSITPILDADGKCFRLIGVVHNITERKRSEDALRKSEEQWRSLVITIPDFVALLNPEGSYQFLNHYAKGFSEKDIVGKKAYDFIMQESRQLFIDHLKKCVQTKQTQQLEYHAYGSDKSIRWYENFLSPIIQGNRVVNILSLARDITERKLLEEALKKSEESFRNLYENSTVGLYRTTPDGRILLANPTLINMLGYESFKKLAKRNLETDGFKPGYQRSEFKRMVENDTFIQGLDIIWKKKDGSDIYVRESAKAIRDTGGKVKYYEGTVEDITEQKKVEAARQSSEIRYRRLFEAAKDGILILDSDNGRVVDVNPTLVEMLGLSYKEIVDKELWELGFLRDVVSNKTDLRNLEKKGFIRFDSLPLENANGEKLIVEFIINVYEVINEKMIQCNVRDITDKVRVKEAQKASELRYRRLFEAAKDGILILDATSGMVVDVNPFLVELLELTYEDICGKELWELGFFKDIAANKDNFLDLQKKRYIRYKNLPLETASGKKVNVEFISNVYQVNNQKVIQCNIRDISDRAKFEEKLRQNAEELRNRNENLERFNKAAVGRELRMIELKKQINELSQKLGQTTPYPNLDSDSTQPNKKNI
jgi:PAS domain S-box-containing protein